MSLAHSWWTQMSASSFVLTKVNSGSRLGNRYSSTDDLPSIFCLMRKENVWVCVGVCVCVCVCVYEQRNSPRNPTKPSKNHLPWTTLRSKWGIESLVLMHTNYLRCLHLCPQCGKGSTYSPQPLFKDTLLLNTVGCPYHYAFSGYLGPHSESLAHPCNTFRATLDHKVVIC